MKRVSFHLRIPQRAQVNGSAETSFAEVTNVFTKKEIKRTYRSLRVLNTQVKSLYIDQCISV